MIKKHILARIRKDYWINFLKEEKKTEEKNKQEQKLRLIMRLSRLKRSKSKYRSKYGITIKKKKDKNNFIHKNDKTYPGHSLDFLEEKYPDQYLKRVYSDLASNPHKNEILSSSTWDIRSVNDHHHFIKEAVPLMTNYWPEYEHFLYSGEYVNKKRRMKFSLRTTALVKNLVTNDYIITLYNDVKTFSEVNTGILKYRFKQTKDFPLTLTARLKRRILFKTSEMLYLTDRLLSFPNLILKMRKSQYSFINFNSYARPLNKILFYTLFRHIKVFSFKLPIYITRKRRKFKRLYAYYLGFKFKFKRKLIRPLFKGTPFSKKRYRRKKTLRKYKLINCQKKKYKIRKKLIRIHHRLTYKQRYLRRFKHLKGLCFKLPKRKSKKSPFIFSKFLVTPQRHRFKRRNIRYSYVIWLRKRRRYIRIRLLKYKFKFVRKFNKSRFAQLLCPKKKKYKIKTKKRPQRNKPQRVSPTYDRYDKEKLRRIAEATPILISEKPMIKSPNIKNNTNKKKHKLNENKSFYF